MSKLRALWRGYADGRPFRLGAPQSFCLTPSTPDAKRRQYSTQDAVPATGATGATRMLLAPNWIGNRTVVDVGSLHCSADPVAPHPRHRALAAEGGVATGAGAARCRSRRPRGEPPRDERPGASSYVRRVAAATGSAASIRRDKAAGHREQRRLRLPQPVTAKRHRRSGKTVRARRRGTSERAQAASARLSMTCARAASTTSRGGSVRSAACLETTAEAVRHGRDGFADELRERRAVGPLAAEAREDWPLCGSCGVDVKAGCDGWRSRRSARRRVAAVTASVPSVVRTSPPQAAVGDVVKKRDGLAGRRRERRCQPRALRAAR